MLIAKNQVLCQLRDVTKPPALYHDSQYTLFQNSNIGNIASYIDYKPTYIFGSTKYNRLFCQSPFLSFVIIHPFKKVYCKK